TGRRGARDSRADPAATTARRRSAQGAIRRAACRGDVPVRPHPPRPARRPSGWRSTECRRDAPARPPRWLRYRGRNRQPLRSAAVPAASARHLPLAQELEELDPLAHTPPHHLRALQHLAEQRCNLAPPEIEAPIELLYRLEDLGVPEVWVMQRSDLHAALVDQVGVALVEPAILKGLPVEIGAGIGRGERHLDRVRVDVGGELDRLLDRLLRLARQAQNERAVNRDAELVAVLCETPRDIDPHALLDVVQDLLIAGFVADQQQPQAVVAQDFEHRARHVRFGVARPGDAQLAELLRDCLGPRPVVGEGVVVKEEFLHLWEVVPSEADLFDDMLDAAHSISMPTDRLRPQTEGAFRAAAAPGIERKIRVLQITDKVILDSQIPLVDFGHKGQPVHLLEHRARAVVDNDTIAVTVAEPVDVGKTPPLGDFLDREVEFLARDKIDGARCGQAWLGLDRDLSADEPDLQMRISVLERL